MEDWGFGGCNCMTMGAGGEGESELIECTDIIVWVFVTRMAMVERCWLFWLVRVLHRHRCFYSKKCMGFKVFNSEIVE